MSARALFRARLVIGDETLPVKMYAAAQDRRIHFRLLHADDGVPVEQRMVHPESDEVVPREAIQRGLEIEAGRFVTFSEDDLAELAAETDRAIEVGPFVPRRSIDPAWLERPYYLGPDGDEAGYHALVEALEEDDRAGICRWAMRKKRYQGAIQASDGYLVLMRLRNTNQVVLPSELSPPDGAKIDDKQIAMAEQLIEALEEDTFEPEAFENDDRERLAALLERKRAGKPIPRPKAKRAPAAPTDLESVLAKSLEKAKERRVA